MNTYCTYLRVSTQRQGAQGLGIAAQRRMCENFIEQNKGKQVQEFMDVESGTHRDRKGLWQAIDYCKENGCSLVIAKLDRLARDVEFTFKVLNTGIDIHFTDMPVVNSMILGVFAAVAQYEREMVSTRTKQALAAKKARNEAVGGASAKWKETYNNKTQDQLAQEYTARGSARTKRFIESRDTQAFMKILKNVFPEATQNDLSTWQWKKINTKNGVRQKVLSLMKDYRDIDRNLFTNWDFTDLDSRKLQLKLASTIKNLQISVQKYTLNN
jgi:DNA invertase Pin-like site-specific DNA recombinase